MHRKGYDDDQLDTMQRRETDHLSWEYNEALRPEGRFDSQTSSSLVWNYSAHAKW